MKLFFTLFTLCVLVTMSSEASAICFDQKGVPYDPVAIADASGVVNVSAPTGEQMRVSGFAPGAEVCRNLLFQSAAKLCPSGEAKLDAPRHARDCKGVGATSTCVHIVCQVRRTQAIAQ